MITTPPIPQQQYHHQHYQHTIKTRSSLKPNPSGSGTDGSISGGGNGSNDSVGSSTVNKRRSAPVLPLQQKPTTTTTRRRKALSVVVSFELRLMTLPGKCSVCVKGDKCECYQWIE